MVSIDMVTMAHGVLMTMSFAFFMTIGSGLMRALKTKNTVWVHAGVLSIAYVLMLAAFGLGVWLAWNNGELDTTHAIIGFICVGMLMLQPVGGLLAHARYVKVGRNFFGLVHRWNGRIFITLAIINGGLGMQLASSGTQWLIAYCVVAGVCTAFWWSASIIDWALVRRKGSNKTVKETEPEMEKRPSGASLSSGTTVARNSTQV